MSHSDTQRLMPIPAALEANPHIPQGARTVRRWVKEGKLTGYGCGRRVLVDADELARIVQPL
jgi:hypothetical protein